MRIGLGLYPGKGNGKDLLELSSGPQAIPRPVCGRGSENTRRLQLMFTLQARSPAGLRGAATGGAGSAVPAAGGTAS